MLDRMNEIKTDLNNKEQKEKFDLNGDGVKDKIQINEADNKLSINGKLVQFSGKLLKTNIVDLNINDNLKELELQILEASTDITESAFFTGAPNFLKITSWLLPLKLSKNSFSV